MNLACLPVVVTPDAEELQRTIKQIGIARFVGRVNSGVIPSDEGYAAVEAYVEEAKKRPLLSKITMMMLGNRDSYSHR